MDQNDHLLTTEQLVDKMLGLPNWVFEVSMGGSSTHFLRWCDWEKVFYDEGCDGEEDKRSLKEFEELYAEANWRVDQTIAPS